MYNPSEKNSKSYCIEFENKLLHLNNTDFFIFSEKLKNSAEKKIR